MLTKNMNIHDQTELLNKMDFTIEKKIKYLGIIVTNMKYDNYYFKITMIRHGVDLRKICQDGTKYNCHCWIEFL